jgi:hypothetical protein
MFLAGVVALAATSGLRVLDRKSRREGGEGNGDDGCEKHLDNANRR